MDPYYCKLYIDTHEEMEDLEAAVVEACEIFFQGITIEAPIYNNEYFDSTIETCTPYRFIECSPYYAEVGMVENIPEQLVDFQSGVVELIRRLREDGRVVTASCDFEKLIADKTGWNWTEDHPEPPDRVKTR